MPPSTPYAPPRRTAPPIVMILAMVVLGLAVVFFVYRLTKHQASKDQAPEVKQEIIDPMAEIAAKINKAEKFYSAAMALKDGESDIGRAQCDEATTKAVDFIGTVMDEILAKVGDENGEIPEDQSAYNVPMTKLNKMMLDLTHDDGFHLKRNRSGD